MSLSSLKRSMSFRLTGMTQKFSRHRIPKAERSMFSDSSSTTTTESEVSAGSGATNPGGYIPISMSDLSDAPTNMPQDDRGNLYQQYKGQLKLNVYINYGLLTVHVVMGRHFTSKWNTTCDSYVKLSLLPDETKRTRCKTEMIRESNSPIFDEKFSFELLEEDIRKRLFISVWHRDGHRNQCEFLGCMSFGVQHIQEQKKNINGWYYLLTGDIGKKKHLAVIDRKLGSGGGGTGNGLSERHGGTILPAQCNSGTSGTGTRMEQHSIVVRRGGGVRGSSGFGFSISGSSPVMVCRIDPGSNAERAGLLKDDCIIKIDAMNVSRSSSDSVARIIRHAVHHIILEVQRPELVEPVTLDHMENSPRKPLCHSTPSLGPRYAQPWKPPMASSQSTVHLDPRVPPTKQSFETHDYGWVDGGSVESGIGGGKENQGDTRQTTTVADNFSSTTLPRSMRFRSTSSTRTMDKYQQRPNKFQTKDYGWLDLGKPTTTNAHGDADFRKPGTDAHGGFTRNSAIYATGTLPRGQKVSFKDFV